MRKYVWILFASLISGCAGEKVDFNTEIRPVLNDRCVACHGGVKTNSGLNLQFRDLALLGGDSGDPAIIPGNASGSAMIMKVTHPNPADRMPKDDEPLSEDEIELLRNWIEQGANWDRHWAYERPVKTDPDINDDWIRSPIDAFVVQKLDKMGLSPAEEASCTVLARRVSLDLTGLPPSLGQVESLCATDDYERLVDELLSSPQFGERWAALWLDLARYADTKGYEADRARSIWRYRDWLINAFNSDMPYDQFTIEQLAGDLFPDPTTNQLIATAFNRNAMTNEEGGTDDEEHRIAAVVDRVNTTWEVFQGTTMACVQCHGHPYDPFVQEDFYASFALFNNTADWDQPNEEPLLREFESAHRTEASQLQADLSSVGEQIVATVSTPEIRQQRLVWEQSLDDPTVSGKLSTTAQNEVRRIAAIADSLRTPHQRAFLRDRFADVDPSTEDLRKTRSELTKKLHDLAPTITPVMRELPEDERRATRIMERGNFLIQTDVVEPGVPLALPKLNGPANRMGFAQWIMSADNPLTSRVMVNRLWEQLFGLGIVESSDDFGTVGIPPSHPELLDWLAVHFQDDLAWSVKGLLKEMVLSATYRQASDVTAEKLELDPRNKTLSRGPRFRLSAEQIRDQALAVSGLLSDKQFGPSVMPPQPDGIWKNPYNGLFWKTAEGEDRYRRAVYTYWRRTGPYPSMATFDVPTRELCVSRRIRTNTPLQALVTLNDPAFWEAAQGLADRMETFDGSTRDKIRYGYSIALTHEPTDETLDVLVNLEAKSDLTLVANSIMNLDEFLTKE